MTPQGDTYFEYQHSRSGEVIKALLGDEFAGVVVTDFYAGYNDTPGGKHQRCWVHFLRDVHQLRQEHPNHFALRVWAGALHDWYQRAKTWAAHPCDSVRKQQADLLQEELRGLAEPFADQPHHPARTLAKRLLRFVGELVLFVTHPGVAPDNNLAERTIRPLVIARKISGGSRSEEGSRTRMILASLVATWRAKALSVFEQLVRLLQSPLPQL